MTEKDEHQLELLDSAEHAFALRARDQVRAGIAASDPLFDPASEYFALPDGASALAPVAD